MKILIRTGLVVLSAVVGAPAAHAVTTTIVFALGGLTAHVASVQTGQHIGPSGISVQDLSLTFKAGQAALVLPKLAERMVTGGGGSAFDVSVTFMSGTSTVTEIRTFSNAVVKEISVPDLDASSREELTMVVRLEAESMQSTSSGPVPPSPKPGLKSVLASGFLVQFPDLGEVRVLKVASHRIIPCAQGLCDSLTRFEVRIWGDEVAKWRRWFQKVSQEPTYSTTAGYTIMSPDLSKRVLAMVFSGVRPVSFDETTDASGPTARVLLRVMRVRVDA